MSPDKCWTRRQSRCVLCIKFCAYWYVARVLVQVLVQIFFSRPVVKIGYAPVSLWCVIRSTLFLATYFSDRNCPGMPSNRPKPTTTRRWPHFRRVTPILATQPPKGNQLLYPTTINSYQVYPLPENGQTLRPPRPNGPAHAIRSLLLPTKTDKNHLRCLISMGYPCTMTDEECYFSCACCASSIISCWLWLGSSCSSSHGYVPGATS